MNLFVLHEDPIIAAKYHCDKHVCKMIVETAQMLCTAHHINGTTLDTDLLYRKTHTNHPSAIWCRQSKLNYYWAYDLLYALCKEYTKRYNKVHATEQKLLTLLCVTPTHFESIDFTPPPLCMPEKYWTAQCKNPTKWNTSVQSYRNYYYHDKRSFAKYTNSFVPSFMV